MGETIDWGDQVVTSCIVSKESDKQTKDQHSSKTDHDQTYKIYSRKTTEGRKIKLMDKGSESRKQIKSNTSEAVSSPSREEKKTKSVEWDKFYENLDDKREVNELCKLGSHRGECSLF